MPIVSVECEVAGVPLDEKSAMKMAQAIQGAVSKLIGAPPSDVEVSVSALDVAEEGAEGEMTPMQFADHAVKAAEMEG